MTPLRQRMIEDMRTAGLAPGTQAIYIDGVRHLAAHYRRSPDELSEDEVRVYLLGLREHGGIQFLYRRTLERNWALFGEKKDPPTEAAAAADCPVGPPSPCRSGRRQEPDPSDLLRAHVCLWSAHQRSHNPGNRRY